MRGAKLNRKGQFTIIAAMLVAIVLIAAVMTTYSAIRYTELEEQPRVLSAVDEINLALKHVLGFTVGYYGSVLQVTGNTTYAKQLALNYLRSGLVNIGDMRPEWSPSFEIIDFDLSTYWFTNASYSAGNFSVRYDLAGLGVYDMTYSTSCRLDVEISSSTSSNQACVRITKDGGEPVINLGKQSLKFYRYLYSNLTWEHVSPSEEPTVFANGTYLITVPPDIDPQSYVIRIEDSRGVIVVASAFSRYTINLEWNSPNANPTADYVDLISDVDGVPDKGTHSNFTAQQYGPDGIYDTLTEAASGTTPQHYYPDYWTGLGSTTCVSGTLADLQSDNGVYMQLRSYPTAYSSTKYSTIGYDNANSTILTLQANSMSWKHTTGTGNDRILLVAVDVFNSGGTPTTVTSITYDGVALTQVATAVYSTNPQVRSYVFRLVNPSSGTKTITVNFSASTLAVGGSVTYTNVNQTNPVQTSNTATGSGTSATVSVTASGSYSKMLFGHLGSYRTSNPSSYTITEGSGQTNRWAQTSSDHKGRGSDKSVTSGSVSMSWNTSRTVSWVAIAVLLQPTQLPTEYTCEAEFTGFSNTISWEGLTWAIDSAATTTGVSVTFQLYNYTAGQYPTSGNGYMTDTIGTTDLTKTQTIAINPTHFKNSTGHWKLKFTAIKATSSQFDIKLDLVRFSPEVTNYALELEEQWINVNATNPRQDLCIKTGTLGSENLRVEVRSGSSWITVINELQPNTWNNVSVTPYITSSTFTIRFKGSNDDSDTTQDSWNIDAVLLKPKPDLSFLLTLQESTIVVELLQNGTMRWLGQELQMTTQALPIPPVPVKAIHVAQTRNGVDEEVPFQIEDWASEYRIPQGLTSNATVFSNRQMIVFLVDIHVTKITIWWDGSDEAEQTPNAYTNLYFTGDDHSTNRLSNGRIQLQIGSFSVTSTVIGTSTSSTANFMRINGEDSVYGAGAAYVIHHGVVRDILQQEAEWNDGANNCPNLYANIVITLPANVTYYTYDLRLMFIDSAQSRVITELRPIRLTASPSSPTAMTENGTSSGYPMVTNGTGTFYNYTSGGWTAHHWSQLISGSSGAGIMFTDSANQQLYAFDSIAGSAVGAIKIDSSAKTIELLPVANGSVSFTHALDITWRGAVVTFNGTTPIYRSNDESGLWILAEYPPTVTVTTET